MRALVVCSGLLLLAGMGFCLLTGPVIWRLGDKGAVEPTPLATIFNPLRDRTPERAAEAFLSGLKDGRIDEMLAAVPGATDEWERFRVGEQNSPFTRWELRDRRDSREGAVHEVELQFALFASAGPETLRFANLTLARISRAAEWRIQNYATMY